MQRVSIHDADSDASEQQVWPATLHLRPNDQRDWAPRSKLQKHLGQVSIDGFISTLAKKLKVPIHRLDLLAFDASQHTVHIALVIQPLAMMKLIRHPRTSSLEIIHIHTLLDACDGTSAQFIPGP